MLIKGNAHESAPWRYLDKDGCMGPRDKANKFEAKAGQEALAYLKKRWPGMRWEIEEDETPLFKE